MSSKLRIAITPPDGYGSSAEDETKLIDRTVLAIREHQIQEQVARDSRPIRFLWWRF